MTSPNTGPQPAITELPPIVTANWREAFAAVQRAEQIKAELPALDEQIATVQARLNYLKSEHKRAGRDITAALTDAETSRELVELWCAKHGRNLPPELTEADLQPAPPSLPPAPAERDAGAEPPLGQGTAGETTRTVIDDLMGGGDADPLGDFQPDPYNGGNGGRGDGRA